MENSTNQTQRPGGYGVLIEPSWGYAGVGVYSAIVFLIVTGLYVAFDNRFCVNMADEVISFYIGTNFCFYLHTEMNKHGLVPERTRTKTFLLGNILYLRVTKI